MISDSQILEINALIVYVLRHGSGCRPIKVGELDDHVLFIDGLSNHNVSYRIENPYGEECSSESHTSGNEASYIQDLVTELVTKLAQKTNITETQVADWIEKSLNEIKKNQV